ncbi:hypothetical protein HYU14_07725 [Candidatus Woesearchaeota archaeon]|nr:hypothetical protein [Candidatus Woesearchaeota archaeon]
MSDEQAYRLGLASILKDQKLKEKHGMVIKEGIVYVTAADWFLNKEGKPQTPKVYVAAGTLEELEKFNAHGEDGKPVPQPSIQVTYGGVSKFLHDVFGLARDSIVGDAPPGELDPKLGGIAKDLQADMRLKDSYSKKRGD